MNKEEAKELRKPFAPSQVGRLPKGGTTLDYVGHAVVTDRLLTIDPEWSWEPFALDANGLPALDKEGNLWIRLTVCGVTRPGVGDGPSMKVRIGDALRNSAMRFGVALDLWSKEELESGEHPAPVSQQAAPRQEATEERPVARPAAAGKFASAKSLEYLESLVKKAGFASTSAFIASGDAARLVGHVVRDAPDAADCSALIDALKGAVPVTQVSRVADPDDPWAEGSVPMAANDQLARLDGAFHKIGLGSSEADKKARLARASAIVGRPILSARELTRAEASHVITAIETEGENA